VSIYDVIGDFLLRLRFNHGIEELGEVADLVHELAELEEGAEATYILSLPGRPRPYLVTALKTEEGYALAFLNLDDVRRLEGVSNVEELEDATTRFSVEKFGNPAPFLFPIKQEGEVVYAAMGFKTFVENLTAGNIEDLIEQFELDSDAYFLELKKALVKTSTDGVE